jgi:hypothetical protein
MYIFKTKLLEFLDELMELFEDKNKIVYKRLIYYHHKIKNMLDEDDLYAIVFDHLSNDYVREIIKCHDHRFMKGTVLEGDIDLLWESCTSKNKAIIWKWIDVIVNHIYSEIG